MIASNLSRRTCALVALLGLSLCAVKVSGYAYTWVGGSTGYWCNNDDNWDRQDCEFPCLECPDDTGDDATISTTVTISGITETIDDLTISNADVRIGTNFSGICSGDGEITDLTVDSVTIMASSGYTAQFRGSSCQTVLTN